MAPTLQLRDVKCCRMMSVETSCRLGHFAKTGRSLAPVTQIEKRRKAAWFHRRRENTVSTWELNKNGIEYSLRTSREMIPQDSLSHDLLQLLILYMCPTNPSPCGKKPAPSDTPNQRFIDKCQWLARRTYDNPSQPRPRDTELSALAVVSPLSNCSITLSTKPYSTLACADKYRQRFVSCSNFS